MLLAVGLLSGCTVSVGTGSVGGGPVGPPVGPPPTATQVFNARRLLAVVNAERARRGLRAVVLQGHLMRAAQRHSRDMVQTGTLGHRGSDGTSPFSRIVASGYRYRAAGENLHAGSNDPNVILQRWLNSTSHFRILTTPDFVHAGVGYARRGNIPYWTLLMARP
jgi:uncharacterized protein YkwD